MSRRDARALDHGLPAEHVAASLDVMKFASLQSLEWTKKILPNCLDREDEVMHPGFTHAGSSGGDDRLAHTPTQRWIELRPNVLDGGEIKQVGAADLSLGMAAGVDDLRVDLTVDFPDRQA